MKLSSMCWCGGSQVEIPVSWVSQGQTDSCGSLGCGPGCDYHEPPDTDDPYDEPIVIAEEQRIWKMSKFNPAEYDPADDSTPGLPRRKDAINLLVGEGFCACGCGEAPAGSKTRFCMGHDARLKGKLTRAHAAQAQIALYDNATGVAELVSAVDYAGRFSSAKTDWVVLVEEGAKKIATRRGGVDRRIAERQVLERAAKDGAIRVGKWAATGSVAAIYTREGGGHIVEYVDSVGRIQQVEVEVA